jgi:hypothetical protein
MLLQATIQAQSAFRKARKAFADGVGAVAVQMGLELKSNEAADESGRGTLNAHSSRPASGASSVGSAGNASQPRLSIPDGNAPAASVLQTPQGQIMRGHGRRHAAAAAPLAAPVDASTVTEPAGGDRDGLWQTQEEAGQEGEECRPLGQPAPLLQQAKQPAVASVMAHASAGQLLAPGYLSAVALQDASETKDTPSQVSIISLDPSNSHCSSWMPAFWASACCSKYFTETRLQTS